MFINLYCFRPSPRIATGSTIDRLSSMSPAAQRLATTHLKCHLSRTVSPSPKLTPKSTPGRRTPFSKSATPGILRRRPDTPSISSNGDERKSKKNLTDDLLQINLPTRNRLKASDFFS